MTVTFFGCEKEENLIEEVIETIDEQEDDDENEEENEEEENDDDDQEEPDDDTEGENDDDEGDDDETDGESSVANNTIVAQDDENTVGKLEQAHAWKAFGNVVNIGVMGEYGPRSATIITITLGPGALPEADRSYDLQGILFTGNNENAFVQVQLASGSANTWHSSSDFGDKLHAKVNDDGSITFSFESITNKVSTPPYSETKVLSGKFTIPADFEIGATSGEKVFDLVD